MGSVEISDVKDLIARLDKMFSEPYETDTFKMAEAFMANWPYIRESLAARPEELALELLRKAHAVLERHRIGGDGDCDYNNDDVIEVDDEIEAFLNSHPPQKHSPTEPRSFYCASAELGRPCDKPCGDCEQSGRDAAHEGERK